MRAYVDVIKHVIYNKFGLITNPSFCTFIVTWACNMKCLICPIWKKEIKNEMKSEDIYKVISKINFIKYFRITGGEPFLRSDILEISKIIIQKNNPYVLHITTNGFFTDRIITFLEELGAPFLHIKLSIDGHEEIHDKIRGVKGSFKNVVETLKRASIVTKRKNINLGINYTIGEHNIEIDNLIFVQNLAKQYGAAIVYDFAYDFPPLYADNNMGKNNNEYNYFKKHKDKVFDVLKYLRDTKSSSIIAEKLKQKYFLYGFENRVLRGIFNPNPTCVALSSHLRILPDGNVTVCLYKPYIVGNLLESSFDDIWFGEKIKIFRDEVKKCSGCWAGCEIGPNAIFTGDIIKALRR